MKKSILILMMAICLTLCFAVPTFAIAGIDMGDIQISLLGGTTNPDGTSAGIDVWGYLWPRIGLGVELYANDFDSRCFDEVKVKSDGKLDIWGDGSDTLNLDLDVYTLMVATRLNIFPNLPVRCYLPLGVGVAQLEGKYDADLAGKTDLKGEISAQGPAGYLGFGAEADILLTKWVLGAEVRATGFLVKFDVDEYKFNRPLGYLSALVKVGRRF